MIKEKGYILIELILSISFIAIILTSISVLFFSSFKTYEHKTKSLNAKHDAQIVLKYIEKRLKEFNQEDIIYDVENKTFKGKRSDNRIALINLSGKLSMKPNTLINFYKNKNQVRINKNSENNVLSNNIEGINVNEIVKGNLIEIEVITKDISYVEKIRLSVNYRTN